MRTRESPREEQEVDKLNTIIDAKDKDERRIFFAVNEFLISLIERRSEEYG